MLILEQRVVVSSRIPLHILFSGACLISVLKIYFGCPARWIWFLLFNFGKILLMSRAHYREPLQSSKQTFSPHRPNLRHIRLCHF